MRVAVALRTEKNTEDNFMDVSRILSEIDAEIARLQQARSALVGISSSGTVAPRRGRPKGSVNKKTAKRGKRNLSPEGRKRIAEAMKRRWAERRASTKASGKKDSSK
jgi:predicted NBD/HSP70 family sugar kinase